MPLLFKLVAGRGFGIEVGEDRGVGINLADRLGVSAHEEVGRARLADGVWRHVCAVLQRLPKPSQLAVYVDGTLLLTYLLTYLPTY